MSNNLGAPTERKIEELLIKNGFNYIKDFQMLGKITPDFVVNGEWLIEAKEFSALSSVQPEVRDVIAKKALGDLFGLDYKWLLIIHSNIYFFPSTSITIPSLYFDAVLIEPLIELLPDILNGKIGKEALFTKQMDFYFENYGKRDGVFPYNPYGFLLTLEKQPQKIREYIKSLNPSSMLNLFNFIRVAEKCDVIKRERNPVNKRQNIYTLLDLKWRLFMVALKIGYGNYRKVGNYEMLKFVYEKIKSLFK